MPGQLISQIFIIILPTTSQAFPDFKSKLIRLMKKRIPFWTQIKIQHDIPSAILKVFPVSDSLLLANTQHTSYLLTVNNKGSQAVPLSQKAEHCLTEPSNDNFELMVFVLNKRNKRYELQKYVIQKCQFTRIDTVGVTPKVKASWIATTSKAANGDNLVWIVGGNAINKYQIAGTRYFWDAKKGVSGRLEDQAFDDKILRKLLDLKNSEEEPVTVLWAHEHTIFLLIKDENSEDPYVYKQLVLYSLLESAFLERLSFSFRFKSKPVFAVDPETEQLYIVDPYAIYRVCFRTWVAERLNRGIFLSNQPTSILHATKTQSFLILFTTGSGTDQSCIIKWHILVEDLEPLQGQNASNIPLSFYFNKQIYADLIFSIEEKQIYCSRQLLQHYSLKFKKIFLEQKPQTHPSSTAGSNNPSLIHAANNSHTATSSSTSGSFSAYHPKPTNIKLQMRFATFYFLIQQMYFQFKAQQLTTFDEETLLQLLLLSNKFQITEFQKRCQDSIAVHSTNFQQLYDFYRSSDTYAIREKLFRHFVSNYKDVVKAVPIGKVQQIVRCLYTPDCSHNSGTLSITCSPNPLPVVRRDRQNRTTSNSHLSQVPGTLQLCEKCSKVLNLNKTV